MAEGRNVERDLDRSPFRPTHRRDDAVRARDRRAPREARLSVRRHRRRRLSQPPASATRFLTDVGEQDDLNRVWAAYLGGHLPTTTTVEVSRLATHPRCKIEISAIAVADDGGA
ncbi:MAG: hypothetical protein DME07_22570 [Candidatus Rokuibacteriota bacterium]|nr:MAG: hypothetical protein DME07_22570 [Candidatus Rokubacteria bacterium]